MSTVAPAGFTWRIPGSPTSREYTDLIEHIDELRQSDPKAANAWIAATAETDFYFFSWQVMSLGKMVIGDPGHRRFGRLWIQEPWLFDRLREFQEDFERGRTDVLYRFGRGMFKSTGIQKGGCLWIVAKDRSATIAIFTHKGDKAEEFGADALNEIRGNAVLRACWPQFRTLTEANNSAITVSRPAGIRESSLSYHSIVASAAGGHFRYIFVDDVIDPEESSPRVMADIDRRIGLLAPLQLDDTQRFWIGSGPTSEQDPVEIRLRKGTFFLKVRRHPGIEPGGKHMLRSKRWYDATRRQMADHQFASQYELRLVPPGATYFRREWLRPYSLPPATVARGCRVHVFIDPAEGKKDSDFLIVWVMAFTFDKKRRLLDLWRERIGLAQAADLLFGPMPGEDLDERSLWMPKDGIVKRWQRIDPNLTIWVENVGASQFDENLKSQLRFRRKHNPRSINCKIREVRSQTPKNYRIAALQPDLRNGIFEVPMAQNKDGVWEVSFGHGSVTSEDERDTGVQFINDELKQWTLAGDVVHDDMLDCLAWPSQPGLSFPYPEIPEGAMMDPLIAMESARATGGGWDSWVSYKKLTWRVS